MLAAAYVQRRAAESGSYSRGKTLAAREIGVLLDLLLKSHGAPVEPDMGMRYRETSQARHVPSGKWVGRPRTERQLGSNLQTWPRFGGAVVMSDGLVRTRY